MVRKQLAEKRERMIELERKRFAGAVRLDSLPQQYAYFDCSIGDDGVNPLNCLAASGPQCHHFSPYSSIFNHKVKSAFLFPILFFCLLIRFQRPCRPANGPSPHDARFLGNGLHEPSSPNTVKQQLRWQGEVPRYYLLVNTIKHCIAR